MTKQLRVRGVRRKKIDEDKIALAYLLLAKQIVEGMDDVPALPDTPGEASAGGDQREAA